MGAAEEWEGVFGFTYDPGLQRFLARIPLFWYRDLAESISKLTQRMLSGDKNVLTLNLLLLCYCERGLFTPQVLMEYLLSTSHQARHGAGGEGGGKMRLPDTDLVFTTAY